ncbi:hypothetical protein Ndes2526B_g01175 [Nannochloris sp. 'desiccata']
MNPLSQPQDDFPSLLSIVQSAIKHKYISFLGDLSSIEVGLIGDALAAASPEELKHIEDATLHGICKVDLTSYTWPLWYNHCANNDSHGFFSSLKSLPPLPQPSSNHRGQPLGLPLPDNAVSANYRLVYEQIMKKRQEKLSQTGKRLKDMRTQQEKERASRSVQVIERVDRRGHPLPPNRKPARVTTAAAAGAFRKSAQPPKQQQQPSVKDRIMKKLNVSAPDLKLNSKRAMLDTHDRKNGSQNRSSGGGGMKPVLTAAVLAGRIKVKTPAELAREEAERKMNQFKAASVLDDDDIFSRKKR